jgi:Concanavalin A-like lectin/glucanases superfamily
MFKRITITASLIAISAATSVGVLTITSAGSTSATFGPNKLAPGQVAEVMSNQTLTVGDPPVVSGNYNVTACPQVRFLAETSEHGGAFALTPQAVNLPGQTTPLPLVAEDTNATEGLIPAPGQFMDFMFSVSAGQATVEGLWLYCST